MSLRDVGATGLVTGLMLAWVGVQAQAPVSSGPDLSGITALKCVFPTSVRGSWTKDGTPDPKVRMSGARIIEITEINVPGGLAVVTAPSGSHDVTVQLDGRNLMFLEASRGGRIAITSVFASYSSGTKLRAAYLSADYLPIDLGTFKSEPEVAQYFGDCEAKP